MRKPFSNINNPIRYVILGAGHPFRGEQHTALRWAPGQGRILEWLLGAVAHLGPEVHFVGGYKIEDIQLAYPHIQYSVNPEWEVTGAAASFLTAPLDEKYEYYVSYADILFRENVVTNMGTISADIVVAIDSRWKQRFSGRPESDLLRCEKVNVNGNIITKLGSNINPDLANAEFIGLTRFSAETISYLKKNKEIFSHYLRNANLSELIELLRVKGLSVCAVDVAGDWAELNEPRDLAHFVLGSKAQTLHRLKGMVHRSSIEDQISFTVGEWSKSSDFILDQIRETFVGRPKLVVRSSALSEDGFSSSNAGAYTSILNVEIATLYVAIEDVIASYPDGNTANEVLVQPMVQDVCASGVVFTRTLTYGAPYYVINYDDHSCSTESITSGNCRDQTTLILYRNQDINYEHIPKVIRKLLPAIREIEQLLDYDSLDIEFAISADEVVHILQVRPIAVNHEQWRVSDKDINTLLDNARHQFRSMQYPSPFVVGKRSFFGIMPDWNPAEIIGTKPGQLALGLYRHLIMDEVWATQRAEYGYRDVRPSPLLITFSGHPYVDIRASFNSFIPAQLSDRLAESLVNFYLNWLERYPHLHDKVEFEVVPTCYGLDFKQWEQRLIEEGSFCIEDVTSLERELKEITRKAFNRNKENLASVELLERRFEHIMQAEMAPLQRAIVLLEDCRRYGTLPFAHLARSAFVAVTLLRSAVKTGAIDQNAMDAFLSSIRTVTHQFTDDATATAKGNMTWEDFVMRYGHLRPGTYDITSPSYAEDPESFLRPIIEKAKTRVRDHPDDGAWKNARNNFAQALEQVGLPGDINKIECFMREAIEGREYAKFVFTRNISAALDCLVQFGAIYGLTREDLSNIPLYAFLSIYAGNTPTQDITSWLRNLAKDGAITRHLISTIELPPLLISDYDFTQFIYPSNQPNFVGTDRITADSILYEDAAQGKLTDFSGKIVLIPQADPGYDWLFGQGISGLITMYGGANSHMAIRAAEFGLPAAIGIGEILYQKLSKATSLELDAGNRRIEVIR